MGLPVPPIRNVSPERKWIYQAGLILIVLGVVLFLSTFVTFAMHFGDFSNFTENARSDFGRAIGGFICMIAGGVIMNVGARGVAGSGMVLDPERAKQDLEPYARLSGGLTDAAFSEMPTVRETLENLGAGRSGGPAQEVVKVRCRGCQALNDETAKFCGQCGQAL